MKKYWLLVLCVLLVGCAEQSMDDAQQVYAVDRGLVMSQLLLSGELRASDPQPVPARIGGTIEYLVENGSWVDAGERLFVLSEEDSLEKTLDLYSQLVSARQALRLAELRQSNAQERANIAIARAEREAELAEIRYRIISTPPQGNGRLLELDQEIAPLEQQAQKVRNTFEQAQATWRQAEDAYLSANEAAQQADDEVLRLQAQLDALQVRATAEVSEVDQEGAADKAAAEQELPEVQAQLQAIEQQLPDLRSKRDSHRQARDAARAPYLKQRELLDQAEQAMQELAIAIEIEKRGLGVERLRLDRKVAVINLQQAVALRDDAEQAHAAGAISDARRDELRNDATKSQQSLDILDAEIAIASRPPPEEELTTARLQKERRGIEAERVRQDQHRILKERDLEVQLHQSTVDKLEFQIDREGARFPAVVKQGMRVLQQELEGLDPADAARAVEITQRIQALEAELEQVSADPPSVVQAPLAGVVRVQRNNDREMQAGDKVETEQIVLFIEPVNQMDIYAPVNEANVAQVRVGMKAEVEITALPGSTWSATVQRVSGIGQDKFADQSRWWRRVSSVIEFPLELRVDEMNEQFRQGMTAVITLTLGQREQALRLPRQALHVLAEDQAEVQLVNGEQRTVKVGLVGDQFVEILQGLDESDQVLAVTRSEP